MHSILADLVRFAGQAERIEAYMLIFTQYFTYYIGFKFKFQLIALYTLFNIRVNKRNSKIGLWIICTIKFFDESA